jgi:CRP/FNR family transcriptional regulator, anaerobic regulatory protein
MSEPHAVVDLARLRRTCSACGLHQLCLPAAIGADDLHRLDEILQARRPLDRGQPIFRVDHAFTSLYVVRSGSFKTYTTNEQGDSQVLGFHLPGEILGFDAVSTDRHQCTAEALERSTVCEVPYIKLAQVAAQVPDLQRQLMRVISREVQRDHEHLVMMGRRHAQERLAIFLKSLSDRYRRLQRDPAVLTLGMSRYELANYLGLVVETVSRLFTRLQQIGVLEVHRKTVRIVDFDKLETLTGENPVAAPDCEDASASSRNGKRA